MSATAADRAYDHVKHAILDGSYAGGALLTEGEVADAVGVSRTPVREAMLRLQVEGMLRLYPKKGAMVVPVTAAEAEAVLEARTLVESWAAPQAASRGAQLADELEPYLTQMRDHRASGYVTGFSEADRTFHERIVAAAGNDILTRLYRSLRERQICISEAVMRLSEERMDIALDDHSQLVDRLRAGDEAGFVELTERHLQQAIDNTRSSR
ncbi:MAG TPA: GntR family transcriptional regulator [Nocardioidaceae bacterium]|nr:GntR family transcriptional regulator [Nocardioidaceae bacterium]